jgi:hypothetical protein
MKLNGEQKEGLTTALCSAFNLDELERLVSFKLDQTLSHFARTNNLLNAAFDLVEWSSKQGRVAELIVGARTMNPANSELKEFAESYTLPKGVPKSPATPERLILRSSNFSNVEQWMQQMLLCTRAVRRVETVPQRSLPVRSASNSGPSAPPSRPMRRC